MKRKLLLLLMPLILCGSTALAHDIEVNGFYYNYTNDRTELSVTYQGKYALEYNNEYYGEIVIPDAVLYNGRYYKVTGIDECAFESCEITSISIPETITSIGYGAFCNCTGLTSISIPNSVTVLGSSTFSGCANLKSINIPNSVTFEYIGANTFDGCSSLSSITIPNSVTSINWSAFQDCISLTSIVIPNSVTTIFANAFLGCTGLTSVTIPNSVTRIDRSAFAGCTALTSVTIPNSVTSIGDFAFYDCSSLKRLVYLSDAEYDFGSNNSLKNIFTLKSVEGAIFPKFANIYKLDELYNLEDTFTYTGFSPQNEPYSIEENGIKIEYISSQFEEKDAGNYITTIKCEISNLGESIEKIPLELKYTYTINKAPLTISVQNATREYGDENPTFNGNYSGFVNREDENALSSLGIITTTGKRTSSIGVYPITLSGVTARNYEITTVPGTLTIVKAPLTAKVDDISREYGNENPTLTVKYEGLKNNESVPAWENDYRLSTTATKTSSVGSYPITLTGNPKNYTMNIEQGRLYVNPATLNITATNKSRYYKESNPELTYTCSGFKNGENAEVLKVQPILSTIATQNSDAGVYPILIDGAQADNYNITHTNAELTIKKLALSVTPNSITRAYGEENPEFTLNYRGFAEGENEKNLLIAPSAVTSATPSSDVGTYLISASGGYAVNYDFSYSTGILTITKAYDAITWEQELDRVEWYTQVELKAESSSGRPITYTVSNPNICNIINIGEKTYLECTGAGQVFISANLPGDKNHYEALKVYKIINVIATGIDEVHSDVCNKETQYITLDGRVFDKPQKGINIVRMSDGSTKRIFVK